MNKEDLNIVYTSKHMELNVYQSENQYRFLGPSLFFKNEQNVDHLVFHVNVDGNILIDDSLEYED